MPIDPVQLETYLQILEDQTIIQQYNGLVVLDTGTQLSRQLTAEARRLATTSPTSSELADFLVALSYPHLTVSTLSLIEYERDRFNLTIQSKKTPEEIIEAIFAAPLPSTTFGPLARFAEALRKVYDIFAIKHSEILTAEQQKGAQP